MITLNPALPNRFMVLEPLKSFADYARAYGDNLARHYEDNGIIIVPKVPIDLDCELINGYVFADVVPKLSNTARPLYVRQGQNLLADSVHPLLVATRGNLILATYLQAQFATFNFQFACGLQLLFPRYRLSADPSFLWRLTLTENAGQHLDVFAGGRPWPADQFRRQRLKAFINIDFAPRHWRVTHDVPGVLAAGHGLLPRTLPADPNVLNDVINRSGILGRLPWHDLNFPHLSMVIANAETVAHEVVFGRRAVSYETTFATDDMIDPKKSSHYLVGNWLSQAGYIIDDDPSALAGKYVSGPSGYAA